MLLPPDGSFHGRVLPLTDTVADLERRARQMSATDRARLALSMIESLEGVEEGDVDEAWRIEAESRGAQIDRDEVGTIPSAAVFAEVRRSLK